MGCPYFHPEARHSAELWAFRRRLPLGDGFTGFCTAPGFEGVRPTDAELRDACNLGCAIACPRLPAERRADAVSFAVGREVEGVLFLRWVLSAAHLPVAVGELEYDTRACAWRTSAPDDSVQHKARCFVAAYLSRNAAAAAATAT